MRNLIETLWLYDKNGAKHPAKIYQEMIKADDHDDQQGLLPGIKKCYLDNGVPLKHVDDDTFKNEHTGEFLFRAGKHPTI